MPPTPAAASASVGSEPVGSHAPVSTHMPRLFAWGVHAFTMSGLVFASLAVLSIIHNEIGWMWVWLAIALVVDGIDGTFARRARVRRSSRGSTAAWSTSSSTT